MEIRDAFQMPSPMTITGRSSSITAAFVTSIVPSLEPSDAEIRKALSILKMKSDAVRCAFCGDGSTEWDHLRPLVRDKMPTGYITEIYNLVPDCGKCNQSKGNKPWKDWMLSDAKQSPKSRGVPDLKARIKRLERYEAWGTVCAYNLDELLPKELWKKYWNCRQDVLEELEKARETAGKLRKLLKGALTNHSS